MTLTDLDRALADLDELAVQPPEAAAMLVAVLLRLDDTAGMLADRLAKAAR